MLDPDDLQFYFMHFMPYAELPDGQDGVASMWVDYPNTHYDGETGQRLYQRYLDEMVLADRIGFDGLVVNEHHASPYSMMPACNVMASAVAARTQRAKICVFGAPVNLTYPHRLAEEYAMLDVLSGGRTELAFPLGTGMEYWSTTTAVNPVTARARFREAIDIILESWTGEAPRSYEGDHFSYRYLNVWPKPYQRPHPRCFIMGSGSPGTIDLAAELGFGYSVTFVPIPGQLAAFERYRQRAEELGRPPRSDDTVLGVMAYVADSDEEAEAEWTEHLLYYFNTLMRTTPRYLAPPGYVELPEYRKRMERILGSGGVHGHTTLETLRKSSRVVAGSPDTVAEAIAGWVREADCSRVIGHLHLGDMPHWKTVKNLTMFAEEVVPRVRRLVGASTPALGSRADEEADGAHIRA